MLLKEAHELAGQPDKERRRLDAASEPGPVGVVEDNDVDVAGIVELMRPELAHGDDEVALGRRWASARTSDLPGFACLAKQKSDRLLDGSIGGDAHGVE